MATYDTTIEGFRVSLDTDMGDGASGCWIQRDGYSASLEAADCMGCLVDGRDRELPIAQRTVARIRDWAEARGY